jgi:hypothetical protein
VTINEGILNFDDKQSDHVFYEPEEEQIARLFVHQMVPILAGRAKTPPLCA